MASTSKKRRSRNPTIPNTSNYTSSSSSNLQKLMMEPPTSLFPSQSELLRLLAVIAIASSVAFTSNFFVNLLNRPPKPYCDSGITYFSDTCELCPQNGECYEGKLECVRGYRKHGKLCIEDGEINENAKKISEIVENRVCEAYAHHLCYDTGTVWVGEGEILRDVDELKLIEIFGTDRSKFAHSRSRAMEASVNLLETRKNSEGMKEFKCPDVLAEHYKPLTCKTRQWVSEHALILAPVFALLVGCTFIFRKISRRIHLSRRAEELYLQICDILEEHALMSKSPAGENEPWIVVSSLRDHLLLPRERKDPDLWRKVETLVQEDSRLDRYPKLVKGESKVVWEWQVEGSLSSSRMRRNKGLNSTVKPQLQMSINNHRHQHLARCDYDELGTCSMFRISRMVDHY